MKFNVLKTVYKATALRTRKGDIVYDVSFEKIGSANSMKEAKELDKHPVLVHTSRQSYLSDIALVE